MKTRRILLIIVCGLLAGASSRTLAMQKADAQSAATTGNAQSDWRAKLSMSSAGLDEVVKLAKSGVDDSVVLTFVQNSFVAYHPNADEIIKLRDQGISSQVIAAMLRRGGELREQTARTQQPYAAQPAQSAAVATAQPASAYYVPSTYVAPASSVVYLPSYPSYAYSYYVPTYYGYGGCYYPRSYYSCYPRASFYYGGCSPRVSIGVGFGYGGVHFGGFYGGHHGGFRHCR